VPPLVISIDGQHGILRRPGLVVFYGMVKPVWTPLIEPPAIRRQPLEQLRTAIHWHFAPHGHSALLAATEIDDKVAV
jgi:hypothetical protein